MGKGEGLFLRLFFYLGEKRQSLVGGREFSGYMDEIRLSKNYSLRGVGSPQYKSMIKKLLSFGPETAK